MDKQELKNYSLILSNSRVYREYKHRFMLNHYLSYFHSIHNTSNINTNETHTQAFITLHTNAFPKMQYIMNSFISNTFINSLSLYATLQLHLVYCTPHINIRFDFIALQSSLVY